MACRLRPDFLFFVSMSWNLLMAQRTQLQTICNRNQVNDTWNYSSYSIWPFKRIGKLRSQHFPNISSPLDSENYRSVIDVNSPNRQRRTVYRILNGWITLLLWKTHTDDPLTIASKNRFFFENVIDSVKEIFWPSPTLWLLHLWMVSTKRGDPQRGRLFQRNTSTVLVVASGTGVGVGYRRVHNSQTQYIHLSCAMSI